MFKYHLRVTTPLKKLLSILIILILLSVSSVSYFAFAQSPNVIPKSTDAKQAASPIKIMPKSSIPNSASVKQYVGKSIESTAKKDSVATTISKPNTEIPSTTTQTDSNSLNSPIIPPSPTFLGKSGMGPVAVEPNKYTLIVPVPPIGIERTGMISLMNSDSSTALSVHVSISGGKSLPVQLKAQEFKTFAFYLAGGNPIIIRVMSNTNSPVFASATWTDVPR